MSECRPVLPEIPSSVGVVHRAAPFAGVRGWDLGWVVTSIERTAYPRFKRLITAHELPLFFSPPRDELQWAFDATDGDEHLPALLLMLKSYQRMGCFPKLEEVPVMVVDFVRRQVELPEGTLPVYQAQKTAKNHQGLVRKRVGVLYSQAEARRRPVGSPSSRSDGSTAQLLRHLTDAPLRGRVTAATNKVESFNRFSQWVGFGNCRVIATTIRSSRRRR